MRRIGLTGLLEELYDAIPIFITGVARSGTRTVANVLSSSEHIVLEREIHDKSIEALISMFENVDHNFKHYSSLREYARPLDTSYKLGKSTLFKASLNTISKGPPQSLAKLSNKNQNAVKFYGVKTPGFERYFKSFEQILYPQRPVYIYCIRDVENVWRSWLARNFLSDANLFLRRYKRSLRQALTIKRTCPQRLSVFNLDEYSTKNEISKARYFTDVVFNHLSIEPIVWPKEGFKNTNSAANNGIQLPSVPKKDLELIRSDKELPVLVEKLLD